jgi:hypothetical protein
LALELDQGFSSSNNIKKTELTIGQLLTEYPVEEHEEVEEQKRCNVTISEDSGE